MATTFHLFPFLPWELRALIWKLTVEPRTVHVHAKRYLLNGAKWGDDLNPDSQRAYDRLISTTPVPATLHTCRESRNLGLYQKGLSEVEHVPEGGESRYLWVNLDIDTIDIGSDDPNIYLIESENGNRTTTARALYDYYKRLQLEEDEQALAEAAAANAEVAQNLEDNNQQGAT
ncbi:hypothetical protein QBC32DRAFT_365921 [Pseudoneurospora amorphoporcata]|uniref:2EXR domain-containing protein n=1 Tax=Pseudoneurospora amorphoporcata TaxID=241081 RepID=A0AAN6NLV8_9PEZI|nr:hypothetical protein QBC32DRAFT_365921 [Pseudoneurospora amorphoporcata]